MALAYTKWSEEEDKGRNLMPDGKYPAFIESFKEKLTAPGKFDKNGQPIAQKKMLELDLILSDQAGRDRKLKDWVMLEGDMSWKFRHLCRACDVLDKYEADTVTGADLLRKIPIVDLKSRKQKDLDGNEVTRNHIADYLMPLSEMPKSDFVDDDIPL